MESADDVENKRLAALGYRSELMWDDSTNLSTYSFAMSIMGVAFSIAGTIDSPFLLGGPASVVFCWLMGSVMCMTLALSIAELVSAYPTSGGCYAATAYVIPKPYRHFIVYNVGWLNVLGQSAGVAGNEWALARIIWGAVVLGSDGTYVVDTWKQIVLFLGLLVVHGAVNSLATRQLSYISGSYIYVNLLATFTIVITLLACTSKNHTFQPASYVFGTIINQTGWPSDGFAFLLGLLSVQFTMTDYDATAHISEEIHRASIAAPVAIIIAVLGTGMTGLLLNIVLVLCSPDISTLPGPTGLSMLETISSAVGKNGTLVLWTLVILVGAGTVQTSMLSNCRSFYALSRDGGLPDRGFFGRINKHTQTPVNAVWLNICICGVLGLLGFASPIAVNAIFSLAAVALDVSYIVPIICRRLFRNHPEVKFEPGPFYLGDGILGWTINLLAICWTIFVAILLCLPTVSPVTSDNFNYASVITAGVLIISASWYGISARKTYFGPQASRANFGNSDNGVPDVTYGVERTELMTETSKSDKDTVVVPV